MVKKLLALSPAALKRAILEAIQQDSGVESKKKKKKDSEGIRWKVQRQ